MKLEQLTQQYYELRSEAEICESWIRYADSIGLNALADELEDRLDKVENLMYIVNTQINKLEGNK